MLAQNFKTPVDLGISDAEFDALYKVLGMLERGELVHGNFPLSSMFRKPNEFNMAATLSEYESCGTIGCLCGWAHIISGRTVFADFFSGEDGDHSRTETIPRSLHKLFRFGAGCGSLYSITPSQAAIALRNYLTHGEPRWAEALAE